jgi:hypothetical protein
MKLTSYGFIAHGGRKSQEHARQEQQLRNREFIKQTIALPSGATFTICRAANASAHDDEE